MSASARRRLAAALVALATTSAVAAGPLLLPETAAADTGSSIVAGPATFVPTVLGTTAHQPANSLRGQYRWMGYDSQMASWPSPDLYYRDQVYWGKLERQKDAYDFSVIEAGLKNAAAAKGKFGFRVVAYCPSCWMEFRADRASFPPVTPPYLPVQAGTATFHDPADPDGAGPAADPAGWWISAAPDWNNETFLARWEALWTALGNRYANDPRLGYIGVGGYGKYGEWWVDGAALHITEANGLRMIKAVTSAFPTKHVQFPTMQSVAFTMKAIQANPNPGIRTDFLGCPNMYSMVTNPNDTRLSEIWKTRPNTGSAPTYDPWTVQLRLTNAAGRLAATIPLGVDLRKLLPGSATYLRSVTAPAGLPAGTYTASIAVVDPSSYLAPMALANTSRLADGSYRLGRVGVASPSPTISRRG